jgi:hypothetical protein
MRRRALAIGAGVIALLVLPMVPFFVPLHFSMGSPPDIRAIRNIEIAYWDAKGLPRSEINAVTVITSGDYAVADTNIDTDNIRLYRQKRSRWQRGAELRTGSYCELRRHGVPPTTAYRLAWRVHWSIGADRYRDPECLYPQPTT